MTECRFARRWQVVDCRRVFGNLLPIISQCSAWLGPCVGRLAPPRNIDLARLNVFCDYSLLSGFGGIPDQGLRESRYSVVTRRVSFSLLICRFSPGEFHHGFPDFEIKRVSAPCQHKSSCPAAPVHILCRTISACHADRCNSIEHFCKISSRFLCRFPWP